MRHAKHRTAAVALVVAAGVMTACTASPHLLAQGEGWELEVLSGPRLELSVEDGGESRTSGVSEYIRPVALDEVVAFDVPRDGEDVILLAGPVDEQARAVRVESADGTVADGTLDAAHGLTQVHRRCIWPGSARGRRFRAPRLTIVSQQGAVQNAWIFSVVGGAWSRTATSPRSAACRTSPMSTPTSRCQSGGPT